MGPRLVSRGKALLDAPESHGLGASMGPRLVSRGKGPAEIVTAWEPQLQWGRDLLVAESTQRARLSINESRSFNGAATC